MYHYLLYYLYLVIISIQRHIMDSDDEMLIWTTLLMGQHLLEESLDDENDIYCSPPYRPPIMYEKKNWLLVDTGWGDTECLEYLRFSRAEIVELIRHLGLVEWVDSTTKAPGGYARYAEQGLCILLYRLASPGRLKNMMHVFGVSRSQISSIVNDLAEFLYEKSHKKLLWDYARLLLDQLHTYVKAIDETVEASIEIWGFIDGTVRPIARPIKEQQQYYSGYKGHHGIKYQSIVTPDGLISSLYGPELGSKSDWKLWQKSGVKQVLQQLFGSQNLPNLPSLLSPPCLYRDPAYALSYRISESYRAGRGGGVTPEQEAFNVVMSKYRIVVEWGFANVLNQFSAGEWKHMQKVGLSPVSINYIISVLL